MTDREIIKGLIDRDNRVTEQFFFVKCRPLLTAIIRNVFSYPVNYDELVNELYAHIMADDAARLRQFEYRSTVCQWLKIVAIRFFIRHRDSMIEDRAGEPLYEQTETEGLSDTSALIARRIDIELMLGMMENRRYADAIRHLVLNDEEPERYAAETGVTVGNLYNIKRRAMATFMHIAIKYYHNGQ